MADRQRGKGEGSLYRIKRGDHVYWRAQVDAGRTSNGKRRYATITRRTKKEVLTELPELKRRVGAGVVGPDQNVGELLDAWLAVRADEGTKQDTLDKYEARFTSWVRPYIGHVQLRKLRTHHIRAMMKTLEDKGVGPRSRNLAKSTLSSALEWAVGEKYIVDNPCSHVSGAKLGAKLDDRLDPAEVEKVLALAEGDRLYPLLYVQVTLGIRQGELLALKWSDVDLLAGTLRVDMSKTRSGERTLPLVAGTQEVLEAHYQRQQQEREQAGGLWRDRDYVFTKEDGRPIPSRSLLTWWHRLQKRAGIEPRRWYQLRHCAATRMLDQGVPMELVSDVLGHSGIAITADIYARYSKDATRRELGKHMGMEVNGTSNGVSS